MPEDYLSIEECEAPADLDRLDPRVYADLVSRPASQLDIFRMKLEVRQVLQASGKDLREALKKIADASE